MSPNGLTAVAKLVTLSITVEDEHPVDCVHLEVGKHIKQQMMLDFIRCFLNPDMNIT